MHAVINYLTSPVSSVPKQLDVSPLINAHALLKRAHLLSEKSSFLSRHLGSGAYALGAVVSSIVNAVYYPFAGLAHFAYLASHREGTRALCTLLSHCKESLKSLAFSVMGAVVVPLGLLVPRIYASFSPWVPYPKKEVILDNEQIVLDPFLNNHSEESLEEVKETIKKDLLRSHFTLNGKAVQKTPGEEDPVYAARFLEELEAVATRHSIDENNQKELYSFCNQNVLLTPRWNILVSLAERNEFFPCQNSDFPVQFHIAIQGRERSIEGRAGMKIVTSEDPEHRCYDLEFSVRLEFVKRTAEYFISSPYLLHPGVKRLASSLGGLFQRVFSSNRIAPAEGSP